MNIKKMKYNNKKTKKHKTKKYKTKKNKTKNQNRKGIKMEKRTCKKNNYKIQQMGGNIADFKNNMLSNNTSIVEIGRGGGGIVYVDNTQPEFVFKISKKGNVCRTWNNEKNIYDELSIYDLDTVNCEFIKMFSFENNGESCFLELSRVFNPLNKDANYTIHPQFGKPSFNVNYKGRGLFLGIKELLEYNIFTPDNLNEYIKDLAIAISNLHYIGKNDGYDIEVFVGSEKNKNKLFIGDFDLSEMIQEYNDYTIDRLVWCLYAVPYFPRRKNELLDVFSDNYILQAKKNNKDDIAIQVIEKYIEDCSYD